MKLQQKDHLSNTSVIEKLHVRNVKRNILKGKTAYGCSEYKTGCDFVFTFENIKKIANGKPLTKELVLNIISKLNLFYHFFKYKLFYFFSCPRRGS